MLWANDELLVSKVDVGMVLQPRRADAHRPPPFVFPEDFGNARIGRSLLSYKENPKKNDVSKLQIHYSRLTLLAFLLGFGLFIYYYR